MKLLSSGHLKNIMRPKIFIPIVLAAALLAFLFSISDLTQVWDYIRTIPRGSVGLCFWLAFCYLLFKGLQFKLFLERIGIRLSWRKLLLAFAVGEMALQVPAGIYAQNYVLKRTRGDQFFFSSAATTSTLITEAALSLITLLILGIPQWSWLRPAIAALIGASAVALSLFMYSEWVHDLLQTSRNDWLGQTARGFGRLGDGMRKLIGDPVVIVATVLAACYLGFLVAAFYFVAKSIGIGGLTVHQAATIYLFSLSVTFFLGGFLPQLGLIEATGVGVAKVWGYSFNEGLAMLLAFRLVWVGSIWLICGPILWLLRKEFRPSAGDDSDESLD